MMKRALIITVTLLALVGVVWGLADPSLVAAASPREEVCQGISEVSGAACNGGDSLTNLIRNIINIFSIIIGIVAVIMIMVGGFKFVTAGGDSSKVTSAKNTLVWAVVGLIVTALSQAIVQFVIKRV